MKVKLEWNRFDGYWYMKDMLGNFMQEFRDCGNFKMMFPCLNKAAGNVVDFEPGMKIAEYDLKESQ